MYPPFNCVIMLNFMQRNLSFLDVFKADMSPRAAAVWVFAVEAVKDTAFANE